MRGLLGHIGRHYWGVPALFFVVLAIGAAVGSSGHRGQPPTATGARAAYVVRGDSLIRKAQMDASDAPIALGRSAISGNTIAAAGSEKINGRQQGVILIFTKLASGWSGPVRPVGTLVASNGDDLNDPAISFTISGQTVAFPDFSTVDVYTHVTTPGRPVAHTPSVAGLATGKANLHFDLYAGLAAPAIQSFRVSLPKGLSFNRRSRLARAVSVNGAHPASATSVRGGVIFRLRQSAARLSVKIGYPAIRESADLIKRVRRLHTYNRVHRRKRSIRLSIKARATDTAGQATPLTLTLTLR